MFRLLLVALVVTGAAPEATIVGVAPNPVAADDRGEFVVLAFPEETDLSAWSLTDDETTVRFPNETVRGRVVATTDPEAVENRTDHPVLALRGHLALANDEDVVRLRRGNETVDEVSYHRAPEGRRYVRTDGGWEWQTPGATDLPVSIAREARARLFVLPDSPAEVTAALEGAKERILLGAYTFASRRVTRALCDASERGVAVRLLLDRGPVGGFARRSAELADELVACGVDVAVIGGENARYAFHHPKYAVVDDRALVLTENWKPAGTGGRSSRGWGVLVESEDVARSLAETFEADAGWQDAEPWASAGDDVEVTSFEAPPSGRYPTRFAPESTSLDRVEVVVAPDNAEERIVEAFDAADESIVVQQVSIGSRGQPFVRALLRAAERGVRVRVLLGAEWYVSDDNAAIASWMNERAERDGLPIEARLAEPRSRYEKIHAKGAVVDGEVAIVGSINWNNASIRDNREVAVILHGEGAGRYYERVFGADWRGGTWRLPLGLVGACGLSATVAAAFARRIRFEERG